MVLLQPEDRSPRSPYIERGKIFLSRHFNVEQTNRVEPDFFQSGGGEESGGEEGGGGEEEALVEGEVEEEEVEQEEGGDEETRN